MTTGALHGLTNREPWVDQAVCATIGGDLWHPDKGGSTRVAISVCLSCPVRARHLGGTGECLDYALDHDERFGIWGGVPERQRRRMKKGLAPKPPRTHCIHGHELARVGVTSQRYCNECRRKAGREYQARITAKYGKPA